MAPLPFSSLFKLPARYVKIEGLSTSSLELDRRSATFDPSTGSLSDYLLSLGLSERESKFGAPASSPSNLLKRTATSSSPVSPIEVGIVGRSQSTATGSAGSVGINPYTINNKFFFFLFAFIGASLVLGSIWFFFWARNGGFVWRQGDWDDYKSTVLRRKGPDGKTLSNATKSTKLGGGSIDGEYDAEDMVHDSMGRDPDVREYRHEKPARVGGINRKPDGSYYTGTNTEGSDVMTERPPPKTHKKRDFFHRKDKKEAKVQKAAKSKQSSRREPSAAYSFTNGDDSTVTGSYTDNERRPHRHQHRPRTESRQSSPRKHRTSRQTYPETVVSDTSYLNGGYAESGDLGTRSYHHPIPGLSQGVRSVTSDESPSKPHRGYRRGRRDSLDSN